MSKDSDISMDYKHLSDQAISSIMMALQKGIIEEADITEILRNFALVEDEDGSLIVNNPPNFEMGQDDEDEPTVVLPD